MTDDDSLDLPGSLDAARVAPTAELLEQNADTRVEIQLAARLGRSDEAPEWLAEVLREHEVDPEDGILVEFEEVLEQDATFFYGTWLTRSRDFWAFEARLAREPGADPVVEVVENITAVTSTAERMQGVGKSFGALALEVLAEIFPEAR